MGAAVPSSSGAVPPSRATLTPLLAATSDTLIATILLDVAIVLGLGLAAGRLARRFGQPAVVGEILAGIALGPSLLGLLIPGAPQELFPADARPALSAIANVGLVLFLFGVGHETDVRAIRRSGGRVGALSVGSIVVPAAAGALVAIPLFSAHDVAGGAPVPQWAFVAFIAVALSVTAFPVLARIIDEAGLLRAPVGTTAMSVAATTDLAAWTALAVLLAGLGEAGTSVPLLLAGSVATVLVLVATRPLLARGLPALERQNGPAAVVAVLVAGALLAAAVTGALGLHPAIGAFAFGLGCPRRGPAAAVTATGAASVRSVGLLLIPVFFLTTGLTVDLTGLGGEGLLELAILLVVATGGKFLGVAAAARLTGSTPRDAAALGVLMNARGLTELVILEVGRSAGILDDRTFTALVGVAIVTTLLTGPLFRRLGPPGEDPARGAPAGETAVAHPGPVTVGHGTG